MKNHIPRAKEYLKLYELEEIFGISAETIRGYVHGKHGKPKLAAVRPGKDILIKRVDFENYIEMFPAA